MTTAGHNQFKATLVKWVKGPSPKLQELRSICTEGALQGWRPSFVVKTDCDSSQFQ